MLTTGGDFIAWVETPPVELVRWNGSLFWHMACDPCCVPLAGAHVWPGEVDLATRGCVPVSAGWLALPCPVCWWTVVCVCIHRTRVSRTSWTPWGAWMTHPLREAVRYVRGTPVLRWTSSRRTGVHGNLNFWRKRALRSAFSTHVNYLSRLRLGLRLVKIHPVCWWIPIMTAQGSLPRRVSSCWTGVLTGSQVIQGALV